jgi:hypothetical protein
MQIWQYPVDSFIAKLGKPTDEYGPKMSGLYHCKVWFFESKDKTYSIEVLIENSHHRIHFDFSRRNLKNKSNRNEAQELFGTGSFVLTPDSFVSREFFENDTMDQIFEYVEKAIQEVKER